MRNLASSTATTTEQIQAAIAAIQEGVDVTVDLMNQTLESSNTTTRQSTEAKEALAEITNLTEETLAAMIQSASATEQQSMVCEEINRNVHTIQDSAVQKYDNATKAQTIQEKQFTEVIKLTKLANDFTS